MDNSKKLPKFGATKMMFTPNLGYKRIAVKDSGTPVEVKIEHGADLNAESTKHKQKKVKERATTQIQSVFSNMSSTSQGGSGFRSYSNHCSFNSSGSLVKTEACQSIQQMQIFENNQFDVDDPMDNLHRPVRLPYFKKDRTSPQVISESSLEYPSQKNIYPSLTELISPESLMTLQFYDSSFSVQPKITDIEDIDLTENTGNDTVPDVTKTEAPMIMEYNGIINENDNMAGSQPIGKVQYYRSGRVVLIFNGKEYDLLKANEEPHHKELFSLTKFDEAEVPDKLVSLGTVPLRLKAVMDINSIIENFLTSIK